ncbi:MAG: hypothetical protein WDO18_05665 [Acidobacteriota bacterium]
MRSYKLAGATAIAAGFLCGQPARQWTLQELFQRNIGSREMQDTAFPPHKIAGNLYYVGTQSLGSFLIADAGGTRPDQHRLRTQRAGDSGVCREAGVSSSPTSRSSWQPRTRRSHASRRDR